MLVLTRKVRERILIGDDIVIEVKSVDRGRVVLGVEAPPGVRVLREELLARPRADRAAGEGADTHGGRGVR